MSGSSPLDPSAQGLGRSGPGPRRPDLRSGFADLGGRIWLNCAHQGPLPLAAAREAFEAVGWKVRPAELTTERFASVPARLRAALARAIEAPEQEIALADGASYGLHLLANGLPLAAGDEVLLLEGDFPSNVLPWIGLRERGVVVRTVTPAGGEPVLQPEDVERAIGPRTRVLCTSWVHSFSGWSTDLETIGALCRARGVRFLVNTSQGFGARPLRPAALPVDAIVNVGWKWLCGPYGTGFCWMRQELWDELRINRRYWQSIQTADDLGGGDAGTELPPGLGARRYDVFAPARFLDHVPFAAALEHLLELGLERIAEHDAGLVERLHAGLEGAPYAITSPAPDHPARSQIVVLSHRDEARNRAIFERLGAEGIDVALRRGRLRVSAHLHNTEEEIDRLVEALREAA
ncbi:MAG TPA: aminotransferase class V-fold PLP-dependent enzyme [Thermoanaerobaculia bacterium]|nr:aminotransferase class V-fold PLP-dependent enzyme [Thermoanaerobaculia bacterium]